MEQMELFLNILLYVIGVAVLGITAIAIISWLSWLEAEYGLFWKSAGWQPISARVYEVLQRENREMFPNDIRKALGDHTAHYFTALRVLMHEGVVSAREESTEEARLRVSGTNLPPYRRTYFRATGTRIRGRHSAKDYVLAGLIPS